MSLSHILNPLSSNRTDSQDLPYYLVCYPTLVANEDTFRLTICLYWSNPSLCDIFNSIAHMYDISDLIWQLFPDKEPIQ